MKRNVVFVIAGLLLVSCSTTTNPNASTALNDYVTVGNQVAAECSKDDRGQAWIKTLATENERYKAASACSAYWLGYTKAAQEAADQINQILKEQPTNTTGE